MQELRWNHVATEPIENWERYRENLEQRLGNTPKMIRLLHDRAKSAPKRLVFAEADQMDVLKAAQIVFEESIAIPILLGNRKKIKELCDLIEFNADVEVIDPKENEQNKIRNNMLSFLAFTKKKGYTLYDAQR